MISETWQQPPSKCILSLPVPGSLIFLSMTILCPDNSTDCLLRAILAAQPSGFNWDPLSFAFTAAIGALALIVAGVTVFQGLLSAGPGRLKASKAAIGSYAAKTKTRFCWDELRYQTTARVPFISNINMLKAVGDEKLSLGLRSYPARWVTLFGAACLSSDGAPDVEVITDHLPADMAAPAAWTTVSIAVRLACIAGCTVVTKDENSIYPIVYGPTCQLRFREHPDLGTVAVFDLLDREHFYPFQAREKGAQEHRKETYLGPVAYRDKFSMSLKMDYQDLAQDLRTRCGHCQHEACSRSIEKILFSQAIWSLEERRPPVEPAPMDWDYGPCLALMAATIPVSPRIANLADERYGLLDTLSILQRGEGFEEEMCWRFPSLTRHLIYDHHDKILTSAGLGDEYLGSHLFEEDLGQSWLYPINISRQRPLPDVGTLPLSVSMVGEKESLRILPTVIHWIMIRSPSNGSESEIRSIMLHGSNGGRLDTKTNNRKDFLQKRELLRFQLLEIDWWLAKYGGSGAACEAVALAADATRFRPSSVAAGVDVENGDQRPAEEGNDHENGGGDDQAKEAPDVADEDEERDVNKQDNVTNEEHTDDVNEANDVESSEGAGIDYDDEYHQKKRLRALLWVRAAVWVMYIQTATDVSSVLDTELGDRIVQLL